MSDSGSARWRQIEEIFHAALNLQGAARQSFIENACSGDAELRREVESLLEAAGQNPGFLGRSAMELRAEELSRRPSGGLSGRRIGNYAVGTLLGTGGMAEVYRARDLTLDRDVAIKVLIGSSGIDTEGVQRFQREARLLASVNHRNVAAVYGFEQVDGMCALVMEVIEGEALSDRIQRSRLPVPEAIGIVAQIAAGVEAAHAKGIIHRDLKPSNIRIAADGTVKVLDFGLAKLRPSAEAEDLAKTFSTQGYSILGTIAYMSPEQARGRSVDLTTDIWAWGCILYEMLSGAHAFEGRTTTDTIAKIASEDPDWAKLPTNTSVSLRLLLEDCLQKDSSRRLRDIGEARRRIENAMNRPSPAQRPEISLSLNAAKALFLLIQFGYLAMYVAALLYVRSLEPTLITVIRIMAMVGISVRIYLISAVGWEHPNAGRQFHRLFPALVVFDGAWAASPALVTSLPYGIALAGAAGLAYVPFAQRTLVRRIYS